MALTVSTPCRIDLAGGTLDLWPICAFLGTATTVNHAISLRVEVAFSPAKGALSEVRSEDLGLQLEVQSDAVPGLDEGPLSLFAMALRRLPPPTPQRLLTRSPAPAGSGLGASSALLVATLRGLSELRGEDRSPAELVALARDLEARLIGVPTGTQDYWSAIGGGLNLIDYRAGETDGRVRERGSAGPRIQQRLERNLLVLFTGESHFSAAPNWAVLKAWIDNPAGVTRDAITKIRAAAAAADQAIVEDDPDALEAAIRDEWSARMSLADEVAPPRIRTLLERLTEAGASSLKLCGAGGGGSLIALVPAEHREAVKRCAEEHGASDLEATLESAGCHVTKAG